MSKKLRLMLTPLACAAVIAALTRFVLVMWGGLREPPFLIPAALIAAAIGIVDARILSVNSDPKARRQKLFKSFLISYALLIGLMVAGRVILGFQTQQFPGDPQATGGFALLLAAFALLSIAIVSLRLVLFGITLTCSYLSARAELIFLSLVILSGVAALFLNH